MEREDRINIAPLVRQIKETGVDRVLLPTKGGEFFDFYSKVKPELYALTAIFLDRIVDRAYAARKNWPPFGLLTHVDRENRPDEYRGVTYKDLDEKFPFVSLAAHTGYTLDLGFNQEIREAESGQSSPAMGSVYRRLEELVTLVRENVERQNEDYWVLVGARYKSVSSFISSGSRFAARVMSGLLWAIPLVDGNLDSPQRFVKIAKNSYPLVTKLAMLNAERLGYVERLIPTISGGLLPVDPKDFTIKGSGDKARLTVSDTFFKQLKKPGLTLEDFEIGRSPTLGCPAMVNLDGASAIKKLWDWHIDIAEKIYPHLAAKS